MRQEPEVVRHVHRPHQSHQVYYRHQPSPTCSARHSMSPSRSPVKHQHYSPRCRSPQRVPSPCRDLTSGHGHSPSRLVSPCRSKPGHHGPHYHLHERKKQPSSRAFVTQRLAMISQHRQKYGLQSSPARKPAEDEEHFTRKERLSFEEEENFCQMLREQIRYERELEDQK